MSSKKPHRNDVFDKQFPVRLTLLSQPENYAQTRSWLERNVGHANYAVTTANMWSGRRTAHVHFANLDVALRFILANPHVRLYGESYSGFER